MKDVRKLIVDCVLFSALVALPMWGCALTCRSAPAPLVKRKQTRTLTELLSGQVWYVVWGGVYYSTIFDSDGSYTALRSNLRYVGTWSIDDQGRLCISETCHPGVAGTMNNYCVRFDPGTMSGREESSSKITLRLERIAP